jgi:NTP pyrophosphatase (non-canonical NTP hydrolase)
LTAPFTQGSLGRSRASTKNLNLTEEETVKITIEELEAYLSKLYNGRVTDQSLFMKLVEEIGEVAEILNKLAGRKKADSNELEVELGKELADVIHYVVAIAAVNDLDLNGIILDKDKKASLKYNRDTNMEQFVLEKRTFE